MWAAMQSEAGRRNATRCATVDEAWPASMGDWGAARASARASAQQQGAVVSYNALKGYGFVRPNDVSTCVPAAHPRL